MDKHLIMTYDTFVKPTIPVKVTEEITRLTGIVQEDVDNGRPIRQVLDDFFQVLKLADIIVGHNIDFDKKMIALEIARLYFETEKPSSGKAISFGNIFNAGGEKSLLRIWYLYVFNFVKEEPIDEYCTLQNSIELCNIIRTNKRGPYLKYPKLSETYDTLFGQIPENLHNSLTDTVVCLRAYMKLAKREDIGEILNFI